MKLRYVLVAALVGACVAWWTIPWLRFYFLMRFSPDARQREYLSAYWQRLDVYGVVLEQQSQRPIAGATVKLSLHDQTGFDAANSPPITVQTDAQGRFSFTGRRGRSLYFTVQKAGYYDLPGQSSGRFVHGTPEAQIDERAFAPDPAQPAKLYLRAQGPPAAQLIQHYTSQELPRDGSPGEMLLRIGRAVKLGRGDLRVECTGSNEGVPGGTPYDWHCRISVPGGGLQEREGEYDFVAPESGYQESVEVDMPAALGIERWQGSYKREYFFHLGNGCYTRGELDVHPGGAHLFYIDYVYNPTPGDRNLEAGAGK